MACVTCNKNVNMLQSVKSLNDADFTLVYAKRDGDYNGSYNYGFRTKGEAFYMLATDINKSVSRTPLKEVQNEISVE